MKHLLIFLTFICSLFTFSSYAQGWSELGAGATALIPSGAIFSICTDTGGIVYAAGALTDSTTGTPFVARWDTGTKRWSMVGAGANALNANSGINQLVVDKYHNLYAAGSFTDSNGYCYVAKWNGVTWSEVGTGTNALKANGTIFSISVDTQLNIYAAGSFTDSSTNTKGVQYVAKWNGTAWSRLGMGFNGAVNVLNAVVADNKGNVYTAGSIEDTVIGNYFVAKWDGSSWSELGTGTDALFANGTIWTLCLDTAGSVYAAGFFKNTGGYYYVAKWDGVNWTQLEPANYYSNSANPIFSICSDNSSNIYAAVYFGDSWEVVKWDDSNWSELGTGAYALNANSDIYAICADNYMNVYAAGAFTDSVLGSGHPYVAEYNTAKEGISNLAKGNNNVIVYPNPASPTLHIDINETAYPLSFTLFDVLGTKVANGALKHTSNSIDVSALATGIYYLIISGQYHSVTKIYVNN